MKFKKFYFLLLDFMAVLLFCSCLSHQIYVPNTVTVTSLDMTIPSDTKAPLSTKVPPPAPSGLPPTWTPLPTYPPNQAHQIVMELYGKNTCNLPCWWGITPGKTSWLEAWQFLGRFATNASPWDTLLLESEKHRGYIYYQVHLDLPRTPKEEYFFISRGPLFIINIKTFTVDYIDVDTGDVNIYTISDILKNYGKPEQIYVYANDTQAGSEIELFLYYPKQGFISRHFTKVSPDERNRPVFTACFQSGITSLSLWPQEQQLSFYDRLKITGIDQGTLNLIKPINQVSDVDTDTFFRAFVYGQELCVKLKADLLESP